MVTRRAPDPAADRSSTSASISPSASASPRNKKYLLALERMAQFSLGLNPQNASYTSGIGARQALPFHIDSPVSGQAPESLGKPGTNSVGRKKSAGRSNRIRHASRHS
jgi:hypothetical protein